MFRSALGFLWKEWCWSWNSSTLSTSWEELTHWKRLWCWEGLGAGGEGDDRRWDGWMASRTRWTWVWVNSGRWWWTGRPGMLWFMGSQRVGHDWVTEMSSTMSSHVSALHSLLPDNIPLYKYAISVSSLWNSWIFVLSPLFRLLWIMLLCTFIYKFLCGSISFLFGGYLRVEFMQFYGNSV